MKKVKAKIYILTTFCHYEQTDERAIWSSAYPTRNEAENAMREKIRDDIENYIEGAEDDFNINFRKLIAKAIKDGGEFHSALIDWMTDRVCIYDIFQDTVEIMV